MDLREYLFRNRLTVKEFSEKIKYQRTYISAVIHGKTPGKKLASAIEEATAGEVKAKDLLKKPHK